MATSLTKGVRFVNLRAFVVGRFGACQWEEIVASLSNADRATLRGVTAAGWYDHAIIARLVRQMCVSFGQGSTDLAEALGRFEADQDLTTVQRWFVRLIKPGFAIRNMNVYWCRFNDSGQWTSEIDGAEVIARLTGWEPFEPALCRYLQGYLGRTLEHFGGKRIIIDHPSCRAGGAPRCEFHTRFQIQPDAPGSTAAPSPGDLPQIAYELGHCTDLDALADALVELLHRRISCRRVLIWARVGPDGEQRLLRSVGAPGSRALRCFVLQMSGRTVGKIEVEVPPGGSEALIEQLLPCIALALRDAGAGAESSADRASPPPRSHRGEVQRQLGRAAAGWALTPRQTEVLAEVVAGSTNKEIAGELACEEGTVEVHVSKLLKKSGAGNRAGLVARLWSLS